MCGESGGGIGVGCLGTVLSYLVRPGHDPSFTDCNIPQQQQHLPISTHPQWGGKIYAIDW